MKRIFPLIFVVAFLLLLLSSATPVGAQSSAILFTGKVTSEATGAPLANISVLFVDATFPLDTPLAATTDSSGLYTITHTLMYTWWVKFVPPDADHIPEFYDNVYDVGEAAKFTFAPGMVVSGIDASLAVRGQSEITGKITGAPNDTPVADVAISVYDENGRWLKDANRSDSTGVYTVTELAEGAYKLRFSTYQYALEYYKNKHTVTTADVIEVGTAELVQGLDVSLDVGGVITGVVTSNRDGSRLYPLVSVYDLNHELIAVGGSPDFNDNGYRVNSLPPGDYRILFESRDRSHRLEYYDNQPTFDQAQRVTVSAGAVTANINAELAYTPTVVSLATSKALPNAIVLALDYEPAPSYTLDGQTWQAVATTPWVSGETNQYHRFQARETSVGLAPRSAQNDVRILVTNYAHLYRSGDAGQTWAVDDPLQTCSGEEISLAGLTLSPLDPKRLYRSEVCIILRDTGNIVSRSLATSSDAGVSWHPLSGTVDGQALGSLSVIVPSPVLADRIYAHDGSEWVESRDGGVQWIKKDFLVNELVPDGQNSAYLYGWSLVSGPPYYRQGMRSEDSGEEWVAWAEQPCLYAYDDPNLIAHPLQTKVLFLRCETGLYRSDNGGDVWTKLSSTPGILLSPDYGVPGRILWAKGDGLWASTDSGASWHSLMPNYELTAASSQVPLYLPSIGAD